MQLPDAKIKRAFEQCYQQARLSPDPSTQNGAVIYNGNWRRVASGFNDFPAGVSERWWEGPKENKYARVVHAEMAVLLDALRRGQNVSGGSLICPWSACSNCAKHIADSGIKYLVRHWDSNTGPDTGLQWHDDCALGDEIMLEAGITIIERPPAPCVDGVRRNGFLWTD